MWPDRDSEIDYLSFAETAAIVADVIANDDVLPVSIGVFGGWGTGKSSMLRLVKLALAEKLKSGPRLIVIEFDAWLFQGYDDARAALMQTIGERLLDESSANAGLAKKASALLRRVDYLRALGLALDFGAAIALGAPTGGLFGKTIRGTGKLVAGQGSIEDVNSAKADLADGADKVAGIVRPKETRRPPDEILAFRQEFCELLEELDIRLVVTIDNLDRCLPISTIQTLEAIRLFLFLPRTAFVVAADEEMIRHAVSHYYKEVGQQHVSEYVDKLIQVPVAVPLLGVQEVRGYMTLLYASRAGLSPAVLEKLRVRVAEALRESWKGARITRALVKEVVGEIPPGLGQKLDIADRLAPILAAAPNVGGNPRTIKRLMNALAMRTTLASQHGIIIDEAVLAKLAVLERVSVDSYKYLVKLVGTSENGAPALLKRLEEAQPGTATFRDLVPKDWPPGIDFLEDWFALEPQLGGRDLRPAVYLTRERRDLVHVPGELSARAETTVKALLAVRSTASSSAPTIISSLPRSEHADVMNALIDLLRKAPSWEQRPDGLPGALLLADATPSTGERLVEFLMSLPPDAVGAWIQPLLKDRVWAGPAAAHLRKGVSRQSLGGIRPKAGR